MPDKNVDGERMEIWKLHVENVDKTSENKVSAAGGKKTF